jgi:hypothetical protein
MRISLVRYAYQTLEETLQKAEDYTIVTHNYPDCLLVNFAFTRS